MLKSFRYYDKALACSWHCGYIFSKIWQKKKKKIYAEIVQVLLYLSPEALACSWHCDYIVMGR